MMLNKIKSELIKFVDGRYEIMSNSDLITDLINLVDENLKNKDIIRLRRNGILVDNWKTIVLIVIEATVENEIKDELKNAISWIANVKESLLNGENSDLYLFLGFKESVSKEECWRIESTEQFCRKYVLLPEEDIAEYINRTFLQELIPITTTIGGNDPLEKAFSKTITKHAWLTPEIKLKWKNALLNLYGSDLVDALLEDEIPI